MSTSEKTVDEPAGTTIRGLMRRAGQAALATGLAPDGTWPYASLVLVALDHDASPLLLLSDLAEHTRNFQANPRIALLFDGTAGWRDPLAGPRASVLGRAERLDSSRLLTRFVARHPGAEVYAGFKDFALYRIAVTRAHLVAGFGRIHWVEAGELLCDCAGSKALAETETAIVAHMNRDHGEAVELIACHLLGRGGTGWRLVGIDPEGCDLRCGAELGRVDFAKPARDAESVRVELVHLTKQARRVAEGAG